MNESQLAIYRSWVDRIVTRHRSQLWDSPESESDADVLHDAWETLPENIRHRLWGLSADLYSLVDNEKLGGNNSPAPSKAEQFNRLRGALGNCSWDNALELLRIPTRILPRSRVSELRGHIWKALGDDDVAQLFVDNAIRLRGGRDRDNSMSCRIMGSGNDIVIPAVGSPASLDACARVVQRQWPHTRFEDAETGEKYSSYGEIPIGRIRHLLAFRDVEAEALWDAASSDSPVNSMLCLILSDHSVTTVLDDPNAGEMPAMLEGIRTMMEMEILNTDAYCYAEAA